jgi:hypothetical protein
MARTRGHPSDHRRQEVRHADVDTGSGVKPDALEEPFRNQLEDA